MAALLLAASLAAACRRAADAPPRPEPGAATAAETTIALPPLERLGALRPIREALALGKPVDLAAEGEGAVARTVRLWQAQRLLLDLELPQALEILDGFGKPAEVPLAELLRARAAFLVGDPLETLAAIDRALGLGVGGDGLLVEMVGALSVLGYPQEAEGRLRDLLKMGSRAAEVYYALAATSAVQGKPGQGEDLLRWGWQLEPIERQRLFEDPRLAALCARPASFKLMQLSHPEEPVVPPPDGPRQPLALAADVEASLTGSLLHLRLPGGRRLEVPVGWRLAPPGTAVEDAGAPRRREEEEVLAELPELMRSAASAGSLALPNTRRRLELAGLALARRGRWDELLSLTVSLAAHPARMPPLLARLRALALKRTHREPEAKSLLVALARSGIDQKRLDPGSLYQLAELFAASGDYDRAVRLLLKASQLSPYPIGTARVRQLRLDQELAESYRSYRSEHFDIRYPRFTGEKYAEQIAGVLEAERRRLLRWIPVRGGEVVEVSLFPIEDFLAAFAGGFDVVGVFDGKVRLPFAELRSLDPFLVSILSHELAHALLTELTDDQAPSWFQEGLAQHVEMGTGRVNPVPDLAATSRVLAFPLLEAVLRGFSEPQFVEVSYGQAAWTVHFIESRWGVDGIQRLARAFAAGQSTEEALEGVFGLDVPAFDAAFRSWAMEAPGGWSTEVRRYDQERQAVQPPLEQPRLRRLAPRPAGSREERIRAWHRLYRQRVAPMKQALSSLLGPLREGSGGVATGCAELRARAGAVLSDPTTFASEDEEVNTALRSAFEGFYRMADRCADGRYDLAQKELERAERWLGRAAEELAEYDLRP
jgi:tetratricopeptide (TPR) repeat protein